MSAYSLYYIGDTVWTIIEQIERFTSSAYSVPIVFSWLFILIPYLKVIEYLKEIDKRKLRIGEPMQICIQRKDNSPKLVNYHLTLKERPKVKSDNIRRFPAHDILQVGFTLQTSRINNKWVIRNFKFGYPRLTLKEGSKVKSDHIKRFPAHDFL